MIKGAEHRYVVLTTPKAFFVKYVVSPPISYQRIIEYKNEEVTFRYQTREGAKNKIKKLSSLQIHKEYSLLLYE